MGNISVADIVQKTSDLEKRVEELCTISNHIQHREPDHPTHYKVDIQLALCRAILGDVKLALDINNEFEIH